MIMKKTYVKPSVKVTEISSEDIIMASAVLSDATFSGKKIDQLKVYDIQ